MKIKRLFAVLLLPWQLVSGHGLMVDPPSRNAVCGHFEKPYDATTPACIEAFNAASDKEAGYKFMSVLTHAEGRAVVTPLPKNVCSFDSETWRGDKTPWDMATNWPARTVSAGPLDITWDIQWGPHFDDTREFHYWITKADFVFDPGKELTWDDFESEPFCVLPYDDKKPTANPDVVSNKQNVTFTTTCQLPARNGHHVIYGEWGRNQWTYERFHGCIDLAFGETNQVPPVANAQQVSTFQGDAVSITLSGNDSDGSVRSYTIETQPKHGTLSGSGVYWAYSPNSGFVGTDSFEFSVTDNDGLKSASATVSILVNAKGNTAPVADFSVTVDELSIRVDGSASSDMDGDNLSYSWAFGDGATDMGQQTSHIYGAAGTYTVTLTVNDGTVSSTSSRQVTVAEQSTVTARCEYILGSQWDGGFAAEVRIANLSNKDISDWQVGWNYEEGTRITNFWGASLSGQDEVTATPLMWNRVIGPNDQVAFGFQGTHSGSPETPEVLGNICQ